MNCLYLQSECRYTIFFDLSKAMRRNEMLYIFIWKVYFAEAIFVNDIWINVRGNEKKIITSLNNQGCCPLKVSSYGDILIVLENTICLRNTEILKRGYSILSGRMTGKANVIMELWYAYFGRLRCVVVSLLCTSHSDFESVVQY